MENIRRKNAGKLETADYADFTDYFDGNYRMKKLKIAFMVFFFVTYFLLIFKVSFRPIANEIGFMPVYEDVVKRIDSPDRSKAALLIRRTSFDLNFYVKIKEGFFSKNIHKSRDFTPYQFVDWNEELKWSYDSSFLVMSVDNEFDKEEKYMWAYDFKEQKEYTDETAITEILNSRNAGKENPVEARYQW